MNGCGKGAKILESKSSGINLPQKITQELRHTNNLIKRRLCVITSESMPNMTGEQGMLLHFLMLAGNTDVFQRDVEQSFKIRRSTATVLLQTMETNGLIRRVAVAHDARLKKIVLTELGRRVDHEIGTQFSTIESGMVADIGQKEQAQFLATLQKINRNLGGSDDDLPPVLKMNSCQGGSQK